MKSLLSPVIFFFCCGFGFAQPVLIETLDYPRLQPGPQGMYSGTGCFLLAQGSITPGDVDWIRLRIARVSTRTVIDVDFPTGTPGSAMLSLVRNGSTGFNIADNNNTRDALCGLHGTSSPVGNLRDSVVDLRVTPLNAVIDIAISGAADTNFVGLHTESFTYEVWAYAQTVPCVDDAGCSDAIDCTVDQCDVASGDCGNTPLNSQCDDGSFCNGAEWCDAEFGCQNPPAPSCDDNIDCTDDYCDVLLDGCVNDAYDELCDNGLFCDGEEYCDVNAGCLAGPLPACDDAIACTVDSCDEVTWECLHTFDDSACDDGLFCNGLERCDFDAGCLSGASPCPGQLCRESDFRCVQCLSNQDCDDGLFCNGSEQCDDSGSCVNAQLPCGSSMCRESDDRCVECLADSDCADNTYCNGQEVCNEEGACQNGSTPCGASLCRESDHQCVQCLQNSNCDDGLFCNGAESCGVDGQCLPAGSPCPNVLCRESDDRCVACLSDQDCTDDQYCNGEEFCTPQGVCEAGASACGIGLCREYDDRCVDCLTDIDCDDGMFCNGVEQCLAVGTCTAGPAACGTGEACDELTRQCVQASFTLKIMPGSCPAQLMIPFGGYVSVAITGQNVRQIDLNSLQIVRADGVGSPADPVSGPPNQAPQVRDVTGPNQACACPASGPDAVPDLLVSFKADKMVKSLQLDAVPRGTTVELKVTGRLLTGEALSVSDCLTVQAAPAKPKAKK